MSAASYREIPPPPDLRDWVQCLWTMESSVHGPRSHRVLPDGCIDILFVVAGGRAAESYVVGMMTRPLLVQQAEPSHTTAVRFRPGGAAAFLREPLHRLTDARVELREVWARPGPLDERVAAAAGARQRLELLVAELRRRRLDGAAARRGHAGCALAIRQLARQPETGIEELCARLGVSRQALAKAFRDHVGIPPKTLARVLRLQRALRLLARPEGGAGGLGASGGLGGRGGFGGGGGRGGLGSRGGFGASGGNVFRPWSLGDLAAAAGFYDQSHMIAEWRDLVGLTPGGFLAEAAAPGGRFPFFQDSASGPE
jgi:AraC-like DNA-binding protein